MLSKKLIPNASLRDNANFLFFTDDKAKYKDNAIKKKRIFQTIGKTKFGGVIVGFTVSYHEELTPPVVNKLPIKATE